MLCGEEEAPVGVAGIDGQLGSMYISLTGIFSSSTKESLQGLNILTYRSL